MAMNIDQKELDALIEEVRAELGVANIQDAQTLVKALPPEKSASEPEKSSTAQSPEEASESTTPVDSSPEPTPAPTPAPDVSAPPEGSGGSPAPDMSPSPEGGEGSEGGLTVEALQAEYAKMPPEELAMHLAAALAVKESMSQNPQGPGPGVPPSAPPMQAPAPALKTEMPASPDRTGAKTIDAVAKSEFLKAMDELRALTKSQAEDIANLTKFANTVLESVPLRKGIRFASEVAPQETPSKEMSVPEFHKALNTISQLPDLTKAERNLITGFYERTVPAKELVSLIQKHI